MPKLIEAPEREKLFNHRAIVQEIALAAACVSGTLSVAYKGSWVAASSIVDFFSYGFEKVLKKRDRSNDLKTLREYATDVASCNKNREAGQELEPAPLSGKLSSFGIFSPLEIAGGRKCCPDTYTSMQLVSMTLKLAATSMNCVAAFNTNDDEKINTTLQYAAVAANSAALMLDKLSGPFADKNLARQKEQYKELSNQATTGYSIKKRGKDLGIPPATRDVLAEKVTRDLEIKDHLSTGTQVANEHLEEHTPVESSTLLNG